MKVLVPSTLAEACAMLASADGDLVPLAGATDLFVHWPVRSAEHDRGYLDLSRVGELRSLRWTTEALVLGAMATYWETRLDARVAAEFPLLVEAARQVGAVQIQSRGTWAGNIANGSPAADGVPVLMAYDATVTLASTAGVRTVPLAEYYAGYRRSVRRPDELISEIRVPRRPYEFAVFHKVGARRAQAITKVGVAIGRLAGVERGAWRIVVNSAAPTVRRCSAIEQLLDTGTTVRSPDGFAQAADSDISPIDDIRSTAAYRRTVLCRLLYHSLKGRCASVP